MTYTMDGIECENIKTIFWVITRLKKLFVSLQFSFFFLPKLSLSLQFIVKYGFKMAIVEPHGQQ
jgi:hypothetical protein